MLEGGEVLLSELASAHHSSCMTDLPGKLSRTRALLLIMRLRWRLLAYGVFLAGYAAADFVRLHATRSGLLLFGVLVIIVAVSVVAAAYGGRRRGPIRVLSDQQPGLVTLVADTARQMNVVEPDRIWIVADARVTAVVSHRRDLYVGLPLLLTLSDTELRALAAHELSIMSRPRRAVQLYRAWAAARARVELADGGSKARRRDIRLVAALDGLGTEIGLAADHAAAAAVGRSDAMIAVARADHLGLDFSIFVSLVTADLGPRIDGKLFKIEDVHDGWLRRCRAGAGLPALDIAEFDGWWPYPFFASIPRSAIGRMLTVTPSAHPIAVDPVTVPARRRLSAALMPDRLRKQRRRWCMFATAPAELWCRAAESSASDVVAAEHRGDGRDHGARPRARRSGGGGRRGPDARRRRLYRAGLGDDIGQRQRGTGDGVDVAGTPGGSSCRQRMAACRSGRTRDPQESCRAGSRRS